MEIQHYCVYLLCGHYYQSMHTWIWTEHNGTAYLRCSLLKEWQHGFFTQQWWPGVPSDLVAAIAPETQAYRVKQVHGNTVLTVEEWHQHRSSAIVRQPEVHPEENAASAPDTPTPEADGVITDQPTDAVWVATADCVPALIADTVSGRVAAVHAGWRGTAQKIVPVAVQRLLERGSQLTDLRVALGPAIAGEVYQVSTTVAAQVASTILPGLDGVPQTFEAFGDALQADDDRHFDVANILGHVKSLERSPILDDPQPGRARLDVRRINELQLEQLGLTPDQVAIAPYCTYQHRDQFFSYRRTCQKKVQWSGIVANG